MSEICFESDLQGCDGVANSGAEINACGQCNVSDSACNGDGWSAVGIAGVTIFIASFLFLLLIGLVLLLAYLKLSALGMRLNERERKLRNSEWRGLRVEECAIVYF